MQAILFSNNRIKKEIEIKEGLKIDIKTISEWNCDYIIFTSNPSLLKINKWKRKDQNV